NAVNCVINIISRNARDTRGVVAVAGGGAAERGFASVRYAGNFGKRTAFRVYGGYFNRDSLALASGADAKDPYHMDQGGFRIVWGIGYRASSDRTQSSPALFFDPSGRRLALFNIFAQDEIAISGDRLHLILGSKFENYTFSGWDALPTARMVWTPTDRQTVWGAVSRAVRIPTQFDEDLRITGGAPFVLLRGDAAFRTESLVAYEIGYRVLPDP